MKKALTSPLPQAGEEYAEVARLVAHALHLTRRGFTLIELSMVLVIIGLVIGAILVGRDIIAAAQVRSQIAQIDRFTSAANAFQNKYGYLPGDLSGNVAAHFGFTPRSPVCGEGDGNGVIQSPGYGCAGHMPGVGENAMFWMDLSAAGLIDGTYNSSGPLNVVGTADTTVLMGIGLFFPKAKVGKGNYVYVWSSGGFLHDSGYNYLGISAVTQINNFSDSGKIISRATIPVIQAYDIDKKMDDGLPLTGQVVAILVSNDPVWSDGTNTLYTPYIPTQTPRGSGSCFDNNNVQNATELYSLSVSGGANENCGISFQF